MQKKTQSIRFHSAVLFFFSSFNSSAVQKNKNTRTNQQKKQKTINRVPLLYISVFKYIHI